MPTPVSASREIVLLGRIVGQIVKFPAAAGLHAVVTENVLADQLPISLPNCGVMLVLEDQCPRLGRPIEQRGDQASALHRQNLVARE